MPWTIIDGKESAAGFAASLMQRPRQAAGLNAIGSALTLAQGLIEENGYEGHRRVIDLSADSVGSWGGVPLAEARQSALISDIVINGLAILCRSCSGRPNSYDLETAFAQQIIGGPGSFVVTAERDDQFADAVRRKLLLEIAGITPDQVLTALWTRADNCGIWIFPAFGCIP